jgi:raffinose/stachyose/melibiose transport system permease protein
MTLVGIPLYLAILTAAKPGVEAKQVSIQWPTHFAFFQNMWTVMTEGSGLQGFINSCLITIPTIFLVLLFGAMAAWVFARGRTRATRSLYYLSIAGILVPPSVITTVRVLKLIGVYGTQPGLVLFYCGSFMGLAIFLMTGFVRNIPYSIEEAAQIDGASTLQIFWSIILPALRPALLTTGVFLSLSIWNDFFYAYFLLPDPSNATLPLGLYNFESANQYQLNWNLIFADAIFTSVPLLIVFMVAQRRIVAGLLGGSEK